MALLRAPSTECRVVADSRGSQTQQFNTRIWTGSTTQHSRTGPLNNATLAAAQASKVALLRAPSTECRVVAESRGSQTQQRNTRIWTCSTTQHSRQLRHLMSRCCGPRAPNVALWRAPVAECRVVAESRGSQTQQHNTRIRTGSTTQHSSNEGSGEILVTGTSAESGAASGSPQRPCNPRGATSAGGWLEAPVSLA